MEILGATLRVCVDDIETAIPFYERLAGGKALRFERERVQVAAVGCFLQQMCSGAWPIWTCCARSRGQVLLVAVLDAVHLVEGTQGGQRVVGAEARGRQREYLMSDRRHDLHGSRRTPA
ncbi:hypothetical protein SALBM217S_00675 [Streptomyces griseoloalbus]